MDIKPDENVIIKHNERKLAISHPRGMKVKVRFGCLQTTPGGFLCSILSLFFTTGLQYWVVETWDDKSFVPHRAIKKMEYEYDSEWLFSPYNFSRGMGSNG